METAESKRFPAGIISTESGFWPRNCHLLPWRPEGFHCAERPAAEAAEAVSTGRRAVSSPRSPRRSPDPGHGGCAHDLITSEGHHIGRPAPVDKHPRCVSFVGLGRAALSRRPPLPGTVPRMASLVVPPGCHLPRQCVSRSDPVPQFT